MLEGELAALFEAANDFVAIGQFFDLIATNRMRLDRQNLAIDPEATNIIFGAKMECSEQSISILDAKPAQLRQGVSSFHLADGCCGRGNELDRLVTKHAAKAKSDHEGYQFIRDAPATEILKKTNSETKHNELPHIGL